MRTLAPRTCLAVHKPDVVCVIILTLCCRGDVAFARLNMLRCWFPARNLLRGGSARRYRRTLVDAIRHCRDVPESFAACAAAACRRLLWVCVNRCLTLYRTTTCGITSPRCGVTARLPRGDRRRVAIAGMPLPNGCALLTVWFARRGGKTRSWGAARLLRCRSGNVT